MSKKTTRLQSHEIEYIVNKRNERLALELLQRERKAKRAAKVAEKANSNV